MQEVPALLGIAATITVGAISPGPSFVMVARTAVSKSRADGIAAAFGMGAGGLTFAAAALLGLHGMLLAAPSLYIAFKIAGGIYLAYLGFRIWQSAKQSLAVNTCESNVRTKAVARTFASALATQLSNPKAAVIYASVFAAFMPTTPTLGFDLAVICAVFLIEAGWYTLVVRALSSERARAAYVRFKVWIDRMAGGVMVALGFRLLGTAQRL